MVLAFPVVIADLLVRLAFLVELAKIVIVGILDSRFFLVQPGKMLVSRPHCA